MANGDTSPSRVGQINSAGDVDALFLKKFSGEILQTFEENKHLTDQVKALSEGDIKQLVNNQLDESMDNGFFDSMLTEIYGLLKLSLIVVVLWNVIPIIYTRYVHKKTKNRVPNEKTT